MKAVDIAVARRIANESGMTRMLILGIDDNGNFAFTTFGRTKAQCAAMAKWADERAPWIGQEMDDQ